MAVKRRFAHVVEILLNMKVSTTAKYKNGESILHVLLQSPDWDEKVHYMCEMLIRAGAESNVLNEQGKSPVHIASEQCRIKEPF